MDNITHIKFTHKSLLSIRSLSLRRAITFIHKETASLKFLRFASLCNTCNLTSVRAGSFSRVWFFFFFFFFRKDRDFYSSFLIDVEFSWQCGCEIYECGTESTLLHLLREWGEDLEFFFSLSFDISRRMRF